jgi:4-alpha-glucanotransferase
MGLFAPLSYLRTEEDWGVGDLDALMMWVEFAKKAGVSLISLLPLNLPMDDNSPYSNVSAFVFDPVYIGMKMLLEYFDIPPNTNDSFSKIPPLVATLHAQGAGLNRQPNATNHETRELKYQVLRELFEGFQAAELQQDSSIVVDFPSRP